jgi:hypothetical protein
VISEAIEFTREFSASSFKLYTQEVGLQQIMQTQTYEL